MQAMRTDGFGERLAVLMRRRGLTVARLGRLMGHEDGSAVSRYRTGRSLPTLRAVANLCLPLRESNALLAAAGVDQILLPQGEVSCGSC